MAPKTSRLTVSVAGTDYALHPAFTSRLERARVSLARVAPKAFRTPAQAAAVAAALGVAGLEFFALLIARFAETIPDAEAKLAEVYAGKAPATFIADLVGEPTTLGPELDAMLREALPQLLEIVRERSKYTHLDIGVELRGVRKGKPDLKVVR